MQVAKLNMTNSSHQCPPGTTLRTDILEYNKTLCGNISNSPGCTLTTFNVHSIEYKQVCGKIIAYQYISPDAFGDHNRATRYDNIDDNYVDGISLTHGSPRKHIWTFAAALDEVGTTPYWNSYCPCQNIHRTQVKSYPPSFVGNDYFCDTASDVGWEFSQIFFSDDPLWDGAGCGPDNTCCSLNNPPWFLKQLPSTTTDDIEMRMCSDEGPGNEFTPFEILELYVR